MVDERVLVIKTGYVEFLDNGHDSRGVSLGDILRITPLLHLYQDDHVTWVTDQYAFPLLENNPFINRLLHLDFITAERLKAQEFDRVINLEKVPGICALSDSIRARRARYGFTFNTQTGDAEALDCAFEVLAVSSDSNYKRANKRTSQELLFEMVGVKWEGEDYILGYTPETQIEYDIALNPNVGKKWPVKAWGMDRWDDLELKLQRRGFSVTRQDKVDGEVLTNLYAYMDWLNSARMVVSPDTLGLHLALALKKKTVGLFGPTPHEEYHFYGRGKVVLPDTSFECMPCFKSNCARGDSCCMDHISVDNVYDVVLEVLGKEK